MSHYLQNIAANHLHSEPTIRPRTPALYEPSVDVGLPMPPDTATELASPSSLRSPSRSLDTPSDVSLGADRGFSPTRSAHPTVPHILSSHPPAANSPNQSTIPAGEAVSSERNLRFLEASSPQPTPPRAPVELSPSIMPSAPSLLPAGTSPSAAPEKLPRDRSLHPPMSSPPTSPPLNSRSAAPALAPSLLPTPRNEAPFTGLAPTSRQPPPTPPPTPTIEVTIGRVEVRATTTPSAPAKASKPKRSPTPSLDDYLQARSRSSTARRGDQP